MSHDTAQHRFISAHAWLEKPRRTGNVQWNFQQGAYISSSAMQGPGFPQNGHGKSQNTKSKSATKPRRTLATISGRFWRISLVTGCAFEVARTNRLRSKVVKHLKYKSTILSIIIKCNMEWGTSSRAIGVNTGCSEWNWNLIVCGTWWAVG